MAYRISQPLAATQFDDDKPKRKKRLKKKQEAVKTRQAEVNKKIKIYEKEADELDNRINNPNYKKIKKKDRKAMAKIASSGGAADFKYTMPVTGSVKGDAMTVKRKKHKLTQKQRDRITLKKDRLMSRQDRLIKKDIAGGMSKKKAEKEAAKRVRDKVTNKKSGGKAKLTERFKHKNHKLAVKREKKTYEEERKLRYKAGILKYKIETTPAQKKAKRQEDRYRKKKLGQNSRRKNPQNRRAKKGPQTTPKFMCTGVGCHG